MGIGLAYAFSLAGYEVEVVETNVDQITAGLKRLDRLRQSGVERGTVTADQAERIRASVRCRQSWAEVARAPMIVIEAVPEDLTIKVPVLQAAEALQPAILATNTSSLALGRMSESLARPERFIGMHFFNPVWSRPLVEVIKGPKTDERVLETAVAIVTDSLGKTSVVTSDSPGFATSRLGVLLGVEAIRMVEEGVASAEDIDTAMVLGYGHPMGPLKLCDLVGLDVRQKIAEYLAEELGPRFEPPALMRRMVAEGRIGKKSGRGFYEWS